jgi:hypothetical protein
MSDIDEILQAQLEALEMGSPLIRFCKHFPMRRMILKH